MVQFTIDRLSAELQSSISWQTVEKNQIIFQEGTAADRIFFLESGRVRLLQYTQAGQEINHYQIDWTVRSSPDSEEL